MKRHKGVPRQAVAHLAVAVSGLVVGSCGGSEGGTGPAPLRVAVVVVTGSGTVIAAGQTLQLTAVARDSVNAVLVGAPITWSTSSASVASVSTTGLVQGLSAGSATVSASSGGKGATWNLVVRDTTALPRTLSGRIERVDATLTGNYTVTGDLVLMTDRTLRVNGTLLVKPGASVTLSSDSLLELTGTIAPDTLAAVATRVRRLTSAAVRSIHEEEDFKPLYIGVRAMFATLSDAELHGACPFAIAGRPGGNPLLRIERSSIRPANGAQGTKVRPRGGNGCDAEIGTARAQQEITQRIGAPTTGIGVLDLIDSKVFGGLGGDGYTMQTEDGRDDDNTWKGTAGNGGNGGHVRISAGTLSILGSDVRPGSGGIGGYLIVNLRSASGPNDEGQSLDGVTGTAGGAGDLELQALTSEAERLREAEVAAPGGVRLSGGNGGPGAKGGELKMIIGSHSARGTITVPAGITVEPSPPNPGTFTTAIISGAANGGDASEPHQGGGPGGSVIFETVGNRADLRTITLDNVSNGGKGYNGCVVKPKVDGTNGGSAGQLRRKQTPMTHANSFNGGRGGDGHDDQGTGAAAGLDLDNAGAELGVRGADGVDCPDQFGLVMPPTDFEHRVAQTLCPQPVASSTLMNFSMGAINFDATVTGSSTLSWNNATGTLPPGGSTVLTMTFNCSSAMPIFATWSVSGTPAGGGPTETISGTFVGRFLFPAVRLNHALGTFYAQGDIIPLSRIANGRRNPTHLPFCAYEHLHALSPAGIAIEDEPARVIGLPIVAAAVTGPYLDPDEGGCGYGEIIWPPPPPPPASRTAPP